MGFRTVRCPAPWFWLTSEGKVTWLLRALNYTSFVSKLCRSHARFMFCELDLETECTVESNDIQLLEILAATIYCWRISFFKFSIFFSRGKIYINRCMQRKHKWKRKEWCWINKTAKADVGLLVESQTPQISFLTNIYSQNIVYKYQQKISYLPIAIIHFSASLVVLFNSCNPVWILLYAGIRILLCGIKVNTCTQKC